ncbi:MAG: carboxylesterase family protein, partial [Flavitalea sp.]
MAQDPNPPQVKVANGTIEGYTDSGIFVFKGIPFAAPPTGKFRWMEPQPVNSWTGTLKTTTFGPRCVQSPIFSDMVFRALDMSEDCLYLNVWTSS